MYSFVLMTAMTGAPQTPEFHGFFRDLFSFRGNCHGCSGSCSGSRSETGGCTGSRSSAGCCGGERPARAYAGGSCYGSCSGKSSAGSCCGGGGMPLSPMSPTYSDPGGYATPSPAVSYYLPPGDGCFGGGAPAPYSFPAAGDFAQPFAQPSAVPPASMPEDARYRANLLPPPAAGADGSRATVVVKLPADATLYAEGRPLRLTSDVRRFVSPPLPATGGEFTYTFRAEYARNGETISRTKAVSVKAGGFHTVDFDEAFTGRPVPLAPQAMPAALQAPAAPAPSPLAPAVLPVSVPNAVPGKPTSPERARITVKLAPGATLTVDGRRNDRAEAVREFTTPPLAQGQEYAYVLKSEVSRNGYPESQSVKVVFRAGEIQTVDLSQWPTPPGAERAGRN